MMDIKKNGKIIDSIEFDRDAGRIDEIEIVLQESDKLIINIAGKKISIIGYCKSLLVSKFDFDRQDNLFKRPLFGEVEVEKLDDCVMLS